MHLPGELCFWLPLTPPSVGQAAGPGPDSVAMHVADEAGNAAPLSPLALSIGQCGSWCGHRLRSGFVGTNTTESACVGIDFHVIPWPLYRESRETARKSSHNLRLGGYYAVMEANDAVDVVD